jgi:uncharacterized protein YqeY
MREKIRQALNEAMKSRDAARVSTLRMVSAAVKDRDIAARGEGGGPVDDAALAAVLARMIRQREESATAFRDAGRLELADKERAEIEVIRAFLPAQIEDDALDAAVRAAIAETGASSGRDMGRVMAMLKSRHAGRMDFGKASALVKTLLA